MAAWILLAGAVAALHAWTLRGWSRAWRKALTSGVGVEPRAVDWTVVIPARNEAQHLGNVLDDLASQDLQVQILVVDDHSTDGTASLAASHQLAQRGTTPRPHRRRNRQKIGAAHGDGLASTPWVVTLDADVRLGPSWAQAWHDRLSEVGSNTACVAGPCGAEPVAAIALLVGRGASPGLRRPNGLVRRMPCPRPPGIGLRRQHGRAGGHLPRHPEPRRLGRRHLGRPSASARWTSRGMACRFACDRAHRWGHLLF